jgi:hypothetical protein
VRGLGAFESTACVADEIVGDFALAAVTIGGCKETLSQKRGPMNMESFSHSLVQVVCYDPS